MMLMKLIKKIINWIQIWREINRYKYPRKNCIRGIKYEVNIIEINNENNVLQVKIKELELERNKLLKNLND